MKTSVVAPIAVVAVAIAAAGGYWFGQQRTGTAANPASTATTAAPDKGAPNAVVVEAVTAAVASMPQMITAVGSLRSDESVTLRPEVAGRVVRIGFEEGRPVAKGALLVKLDAAVNDAEVQQAKANLVLAKSKYERAIDLQKQNFISGQARDEAENNFKVAEAAQALAAARLAKTEIRAPFSGIIGLRSVSIGDYVKEGQDMVNLESIDPLKVDFRVPEIYLKQVQVGQTLEIGLDALPGKTYQGKVTAINPLVDAAGRAIVIRALVKNQPAQRTSQPLMRPITSAVASNASAWYMWYRTPVSNTASMSGESRVRRPCAPKAPSPTARKAATDPISRKFLSTDGS